jgi:hypothetical protein
MRRGFALTLEAVIVLLLALSIAALVRPAHHDASPLVKQAQAGDVAEILVRTMDWSDPEWETAGRLAAMLDRKARVSIDGDVVFDQQPGRPAAVQRTVLLDSRFRTMTVELGE